MIYICSNKLIAKYLINLEKKLRSGLNLDENESNRAFEEFKNMF